MASGKQQSALLGSQLTHVHERHFTVMHLNVRGYFYLPACLNCYCCVIRQSFGQVLMYLTCIWKIHCSKSGFDTHDPERRVSPKTHTRTDGRTVISHCYLLCINQAVTIRTKITTVECRRHIN